MHNIEDAFFFGQFGDGEHVFIENDGFGVGIGYARTLVFFSKVNNIFGIQNKIFSILRRSLRNLPVLTVFAREVAPCYGQRKRGRSRKKMEEWLLLDRINVEGARIPIGQCIIFAFTILPCPAKTSHSRFDLALPGAEDAFDFAFCKCFIILCRLGVYIAGFHLLSISTVERLNKDCERGSTPEALLQKITAGNLCFKE